MSAVGINPASIVRSSPALASKTKGAVTPFGPASESVASFPLLLVVKSYSVVPGAVVGSKATLYVPLGTLVNK